MILRKVKSEDFEIVKELYEDKNAVYQWLWGIEENNIEEENKLFELELDEPLFIYTREKFEKERISKENQMYMIQRKKEILGYIRLCRLPKKEYRILEWGLFDPEDDIGKEETLIGLENQKSFRSISVATMLEKSSVWLEAHGFIKQGIFFTKFLRNPEKRS